MMKRIIGLAFGAIVAAGAASAATLTYSFDTGNEGWVASKGVLTHVATGGNGGGYLQTSDIAGERMGIKLGDRKIGDMRGYDGGTFSMDAIMVSQRAAGDPDLKFGKVKISGGGQSAILDVFPGLLTSSWQTSTVSFDAVTWGVSQSIWDMILTDVTSVRIVTDAWRSRHEVTGVDNITFTAPQVGINRQAQLPGAVPLPAGAVLLLSGLGLFAATRRLKRG